MKNDLYFMRIAREVASNSKCLSRKIGSVLVKDGAIISTGYNGPARGVKHCNERSTAFYNKINSKTVLVINGETESEDYIWDICPRRALGYPSGEGLHLCQAGHSERNALIQAARNGISTKDTTLYAYCTMPCKDCTIELVNAGVRTIVCLFGEKHYDSYAEIIATEAGMEIRFVRKEDL